MKVLSFEMMANDTRAENAKQILDEHLEQIERELQEKGAVFLWNTKSYPNLNQKGKRHLSQCFVAKGTDNEFQWTDVAEILEKYVSSKNIHYNFVDMDEEIAQRTVEKSPSFYEKLPLMFRDNEKITKTAVSKMGEMFKYASERLKKNATILLSAIKSFAGAILYAPAALFGRKDVSMVAVSREGKQLKNISEPLRNDREVVMAAVKSDPAAYEFASDELKKDKEITMIALSGESDMVDFVPKELYQDKAVAVAAMKQNSMAIRYVPDELKKDTDIAMIAAASNSTAIKYVHSDLFRDEAFVKEALAAAKKNNAKTIASMICEDLMKKKEIALAVVAVDPRMYQKIAKMGFAQDKEITVEAVKQCGEMLVYADAALKQDKELVLEAIAVNPDVYCKEVLGDDKDSLWFDQEVAKAAIDKNPDAYFDLPDEMKNEPTLAIQALLKDGMLLEHMSDEMKAIPDVVAAAVHNNADAIQFVPEEMRGHRDVLRILMDEVPVSYIQNQDTTRPKKPKTQDQER